MTVAGSVQVSEGWNVAYPTPGRQLTEAWDTSYPDRERQLTENWDVIYTLDSGSGGAGEVSTSGFVFSEGQGVTLGASGDHTFVREAGGQVSDTDQADAPFVFEAGTGVDLGGETGTDFDAEGTVNEPWNIGYPSLAEQATEDWDVDYPSLVRQLTKDWEG